MPQWWQAALVQLDAGTSAGGFVLLLLLLLHSRQVFDSRQDVVNSWNARKRSLHQDKHHLITPGCPAPQSPVPPAGALAVKHQKHVVTKKNPVATGYSAVVDRGILNQSGHVLHLVHAHVTLNVSMCGARRTAETLDMKSSRLRSEAM